MKNCGVRRAAYVTISGRQEKTWKRSLANIHGVRKYLKMGTEILKSFGKKGVQMWTDSTISGQSCRFFCKHCDWNTGPVTNLIKMSHSWAAKFFPPLDPVLSQLNPLRRPLTPYKLHGYQQNWSNNVHTWKEIAFPSMSSVTDRMDDRFGGAGGGGLECDWVQSSCNL